VLATKWRVRHDQTSQAPPRHKPTRQAHGRYPDGEVEDREPTPEERGVDPAASAMGKKGGPARAASMTSERRAEIAKKAAKARWRP
jgi:hypothetical protein